MRKKWALYFFAFFVLSISSACKKSGGGSCSETGLTFTSSPALNSTEAPAPGPDFPLTITVGNPMPSGGVSITVTAKPETPAGSAPFYTETKNSSTAVNNFTITNTPQSVSAIVEITVTSKSCASNKSSGSYRYSRK